MVITQIIYINPGKEAEFEMFETIAIPIISRYNGKLLLRLRPGDTGVIQSSIGNLYELHLVSFEIESDYGQFLQDEERKSYLHLKEAAIKRWYSSKVSSCSKFGKQLSPIHLA